MNLKGKTQEKKKVEYLDIFDDEMNLIGLAPRAEVHKNGYWHLAFQCWFMRKDGDKKYVIFQKRCYSKDTYPNLFDTSSAGHLSSGESIEDGVRELREELGIEVKYNELIPIGIIKQMKEEKEFMDYQFAYLYLYESNIPIKEYRIQKEEITALVEMDIESMKSLIEGNVNSVKVYGVSVDENGENHKEEYNIAYGDLVPHGRDYYNKVYDEVVKYYKQL